MEIDPFDFPYERDKEDRGLEEQEEKCSYCGDPLSGRDEELCSECLEDELWGMQYGNY